MRRDQPSAQKQAPRDGASSSQPLHMAGSEGFRLTADRCPQIIYPLNHTLIKFNRQFDPSSLKLVIFDLDGTLIDSRLDLVHSVNATLRHMKRPELPEDVIAGYVGRRTRAHRAGFGRGSQ